MPVFNNDEAAAGDELASVDWSNSLGIRLSHNLHLKPEIKLFAFRERILKETATNLQFLINLSYSHIWKPQYMKFFRSSQSQ